MYARAMQPASLHAGTSTIAALLRQDAEGMCGTAVVLFLRPGPGSRHVHRDGEGAVGRLSANAGEACLAGV